MVSTRLSPTFPPLNYGISKENQEIIYDLNEKQNSLKTS